MEPIKNYQLAFGGNPQTMSALTHLGNLVPHSTDRNAYKKDGTPFIDYSTGIINKVIVGSARQYFGQREDTKLLCRTAILKSLQVPRSSDQPIKNIRYPTEEGEAKADFLVDRINWLVDNMKHCRQEAQLMAMDEMSSFFQSENLDEQDPLGSLTELLNLADVPYKGQQRTTKEIVQTEYARYYNALR